MFSAPHSEASSAASVSGTEIQGTPRLIGGAIRVSLASQNALVAPKSCFGAERDGVIKTRFARTIPVAITYTLISFAFT